MALQYRVTKRKNNIKQQSDLYIMQAIHTGVITTEKLSELISSESSLTKTDVIAVLHFLGKKMQLYLEQVKVIDLDYIGKFKMGFQCKGAEDPSQLKSPQSIKKFQFKYPPRAKIKNRFKKGIPVLKEV